MNALRPIALIVALLCTATAPSFGSSNLTLQAEDYLSCPGIQPTFDRKASLTQIMEERRTFAATISADQRPLSMTFFGVRIDDPPEVLKWRENEDKRVRALIPSQDMDKVKAFAEKVRGQISDIDKKFPLGLSGDLSLTQVTAAHPEKEGEEIWKVEVVAPVASPDYTMKCQWDGNNDETLVLRITLVRPSVYHLLDREPEISALKSVFSPKGDPRPKVEIWVRVIDADMPMKVNYRRLSDGRSSGP